MCEVCQKRPATSFSWFKRGEWLFTCDCTSDTETYYIELRKFFKNNGATIDWLAHMSEKDWMDWNDFMKMMHRFREATNSYFML